MSSITSEYNDRTKRAYLSMTTFETDIFSYTTSLNNTTYVIEGTLAPITGATTATCPQGRFLYENGKKLYPGANPGVNTYMVGVFDPNSFLSGFIDPNSEAFTLMNTDKPVDMANSSNVFGTNPNGSTSDLAQPVYTRGDVIIGGKLIVDAVTGSGNSAIVGTATLGSASASTALVNTSAVTAASKIFLTYASLGGSGTQGALRIGTITAGTSFQIISSGVNDISTVNWFIIN